MSRAIQSPRAAAKLTLRGRTRQSAPRGFWLNADSPGVGGIGNAVPSGVFDRGSYSVLGTKPVWRITVQRSGHPGVDVTDMVTGFSWTEPRDSAIQTGSVTWVEPKDVAAKKIVRSGDVLVCEEATRADGPYVEVWRLRMREPSLSEQTGERTWSLANDLLNLQSSTDDFKFRKGKHHPNGWRVDEIVKYVCERYHLPAVVPICQARVKNRTWLNTDALTVINDAFTVERTKKGKRFVLRFRKGVLMVSPLMKSQALGSMASEIVEAVYSETFDSEFATAATIRANPTETKQTAAAANADTPSSRNITLSHQELEELWVYVGGDPAVADTMAAIAQAESGGCIYAHAGPVDNRPVHTCLWNPTNGEDSYGLWQINLRAWTQTSAGELYTAEGNARQALAIQRSSGFTPWSTYNSGAYLSFLAHDTPSGSGVAPPSPSAGGDVVQGYKISVPVESKAAIDRWGYVHRIEYVDGHVSSVAEAKKLGMLHLAKIAKAQREIVLTHAGNTSLKKGDAIYLQLRELGLRVLVWVAEVSHTVDPTGYSMDVTCVFETPFTSTKTDRVSEEEPSAPTGKKLGKQPSTNTNRADGTTPKIPSSSVTSTAFDKLAKTATVRP